MGDIILTGFWVIVSSLCLALGLAIYGLPTIVAVIRKSPNIALIATVNLVLSGLVVPWWIALGMALWSSVRRGDVTVIQTTSLPPAPPAVLNAASQDGAYAPAPGALPAAPPVQPSTLSPPQVGRREDPLSRRQPSSAPTGFVPPVPYGEGSPASYQRPCDRGW